MVPVPGWSGLKGPALIHLLNTLELFLGGKAGSYHPTCLSVIHGDCVMGSVSQHYEFIQAS